jgi:hypothetical protein
VLILPFSAKNMKHENSKMQEVCELLSIVDEMCTYSNAKLSSNERKSMCTIGRSRNEYISETLEMFKNEDICLAKVDTTQLTQLSQEVTLLSDIIQRIDSIRRKLSDHYFILGQDTYKEAKSVRKSVEAMAITNGELKLRMEELGCAKKRKYVRKEKC